MASIFLLYRNILENSTLTVTNEDTDYPKWRLHDRDVGKLFKATSTADHTVQADQGATTQYDVDTLIIPSGHNLYGGPQLDWEHSDNGSTWTDMVTAWAGAAGLISKAVASPVTARYWRLVMTSLAGIPQIPELWMGEAVELANVVQWGHQDGPQGNVSRTESVSGRPHFLVNGEDREYRNYSCRTYDSNVRDDLADFFAHSRGKPFWLKDLDGTWRFMSLVNPNVGPFDRPRLNRFEINLEMIEVLP